MPVLAALLLAAAPAVTVDFKGPLGEGLSKIAREGRLSLITLGEFNDDATVHLEGVPADVALRSLADAYGFELTNAGDVWTAKRAVPPPTTAVIPPPVAPARSGEAEIVARGPITVTSDRAPKGVVTYGGGIFVAASGQVDGDAVALGGDIDLGAGSVVRGDAIAIGGEVRRAPGAHVTGNEVSLSPKAIRETFAQWRADAPPVVPKAPPTVAQVASRLLLNFALLFALGFAGLSWAPARMGRVEAEVRRSPWRSLGLGLVAFVALVPLTVMLCISIVGIPLALALWLALGLALLLGLTAAAKWLGDALPWTRGKPVLAMGLGVAFVVGLSVVPIAGGLLQSALGFTAMGALLATRLGRHGPSTPVVDFER